MHSDELRFFLAVARSGSIGEAARVLNTVQSNVTARVRKLETGVGQPLFQRHARGVTLTPAGERLMPFALQIDELLVAAQRCVADDEAPSGSLRIGAMETTTAMRLGHVLADFTARFPRVDLALETGTTEELVEAVVSHRLEAAFVCAPVRSPRLQSRPAFVEEMCLIAPPGMKSLAEVADLPQPRAFVLRRGCTYRRMLEAMLAREGVSNLRVMEYGTLDAILASVAAGLGVSYLPRRMMEGRVDWQALSQLPLTAGEAEVETVLVTPARSYRSGALRGFLEVVEESGGGQRVT